ncbi:unnamed protein product [Rangifer tarandus platyrhynchus]|uniref:Uncharacterized protein n=2 Tax=Rangifer tarandus platyrhynchus TaxID=3082113 RepID=A0ACB1KGR7_RANTA|nr:unnamed protein product [Rangifer tarandus platyrhynchus]
MGAGVSGIIRVKYGECGQGSKDRSSLITHQRTHTWEKPYVCMECGQSCSQKSHRIRQQKTHRGVALCLWRLWAQFQSSQVSSHTRGHTLGRNRIFEESVGESSVRSQFAESRGHTGEKPRLWGLWVKLQCEVQSHQTPEERHRGEDLCLWRLGRVSVRSPIPSDNRR